MASGLHTPDASTGGGAVPSAARFCVSVATDIYGRKYNREFAFASPPVINTFINIVEGQYDAIARANRPPGFPDVPFEAQTFQMFDVLSDAWADLFSVQQLENGMQLYCFQPFSMWHSDVQDGIPSHSTILPWMTVNGRMVRKPSDAGVPASLSEMIRSTFAETDTGRKGFLTFSDVRNGLGRAEMQPVSSTLEAIFEVMDDDCDGHVSYEEWTTFALAPRYTDMVTAWHFRYKDMWVNRKRRVSQRELSLANQREAAILLEQEKEEAWHRHRTVAQKRYEEARLHGASARRQAEDASAREQATYEQLYSTKGSAGRGDEMGGGVGGGGSQCSAEKSDVGYSKDTGVYDVRYVPIATGS